MVRANIVIFDKGGIWMGDFYVYKSKHIAYLQINE